MIGLTSPAICLYEATNLTKAFFCGAKICFDRVGDEANIVVEHLTDDPERVAVTITDGDRISSSEEPVLFSNRLGTGDIDLAMGRAFYRAASEFLKKQLPWGILTGVRPAKLFSSLCDEMSEAEASRVFEQDYYIDPNKTTLCRMIHDIRPSTFAKSGLGECSLYISIPYCPSRCAYCSFASKDNDRFSEAQLEQYFGLLCRELEQMFEHIEQTGEKLVTVYIGGGTPAVLDERQLQRLLLLILRHRQNINEITVEMGRPDAITPAKLRAVRSLCRPRISINPQTLSDDVLRAIGRRHTVREFFDAYELADRMGFDNINTDVISGLPSDTAEGFENTMAGIIALNPASVTVHSYAKKRSSELALSGNADKLLADSQPVFDSAGLLLSAGYNPYYLYRQKDISGGNENVGWCRDGYYGLYNIYMMDELHTVYSCGAGGVTKAVSPDTKLITRFYNQKLPLEYIRNFDTMMEKKREYLRNPFESGHQKDSDKDAD